MTHYFDVTANIKRIVLETQKIQRAVDSETKKPIIKSLAFLRRRMRSQLRRRKRASRPGQPASVHSTDPVATLKRIFFAYDDRTKSGIVGPVKLSTVANRRNGEPLPGLLEVGGTVHIPEGAFTVAQDRGSRGRFTEKRLVRAKKAKRLRISARPNAAIALSKANEAGEIISPWSNVVTG